MRERRDALRQYHASPWWLRTNYAEELHSSPQDRAATRERHYAKSAPASQQQDGNPKNT